ncbi:hypothetical protein FRA_31c04790 [Francisella sp. W12-1067]|nr:hypothetical protein FRA_31c04790 [Francisella sp. W12-1067]
MLNGQYIEIFHDDNFMCFEKELKTVNQEYLTAKHIHHKKRLKNLIDKIRGILTSNTYKPRKKHLIIKDIISSEINSYNTQRQGYSFLSKHKLHLFADKYFLTSLYKIEKINQRYFLDYIKGKLKSNSIYSCNPNLISASTKDIKKYLINGGKDLLYPFLNPNDEKYTDFRKIFETSLAYLLIKEKSKNQGLASFIDKIFNQMITYLESLFSFVKIDYLYEKHDRINNFLDSKRIYNLVCLTNSASPFSYAKAYLEYFDDYELVLEKDYQKIYNKNIDSRLVEYYSVIYELYSKKENLFIIKASASIMLVQAINWMLYVLNDKKEFFLENNGYIADYVLKKLYLTDKFKNKGPEKVDSPKNYEKMGFINKENTGEEFKRPNKIFNNYVPKAYIFNSPKDINSNWNNYRKEHNQLYISGISGLGLMSVKVLFLLHVDKEKYNQYFEIIAPIILYYFSGHSFFEVHQAMLNSIESLNNSSAILPAVDIQFNDWANYINTIPDIILRSAFRLALVTDRGFKT